MALLVSKAEMDQDTGLAAGYCQSWSLAGGTVTIRTLWLARRWHRKSAREEKDWYGLHIRQTNCKKMDNNWIRVEIHSHRLILTHHVFSRFEVLHNYECYQVLNIILNSTRHEARLRWSIKIEWNLWDHFNMKVCVNWRFTVRLIYRWHLHMTGSVSVEVQFEFSHTHNDNKETT